MVKVVVTAGLTVLLVKYGKNYYYCYTKHTLYITTIHAKKVGKQVLVKKFFE